jgi:hypothetical protein
MQTWREFEGTIADLLDADNPALMRYYSQDRLFSEDAREQFVEADREQLPKLRDADIQENSNG